MKELESTYFYQLHLKIEEEKRNPRAEKLLAVGDFILVNPVVAGKEPDHLMILAKIVDMFLNEHGEPCFRVITEGEECYDITNENQFKTIYLD